MTTFPHPALPALAAEGITRPYPVTVRCFFAPACGHTETGNDPEAAHAQMENHYRDRHAADLARICPPTRPRHQVLAWVRAHHGNSTSEVAAGTGLTRKQAERHLAALRAGGFVESFRYGERRPWHWQPVTVCGHFPPPAP